VDLPGTIRTNPEYIPELRVRGQTHMEQHLRGGTCEIELNVSFDTIKFLPAGTLAEQLASLEMPITNLHEGG
jgi:hypothetical protein